MKTTKINLLDENELQIDINVDGNDSSSYTKNNNIIRSTMHFHLLIDNQTNKINYINYT